jgi:hypothetical protein
MPGMMAVANTRPERSVVAVQFTAVVVTDRSVQSL